MIPCKSLTSLKFLYQSQKALEQEATLTPPVYGCFNSCFVQSIEAIRQYLEALHLLLLVKS